MGFTLQQAVGGATNNTLGFVQGGITVAHAGSLLIYAISYRSGLTSKIAYQSVTDNGGNILNGGVVQNGGFIAASTIVFKSTKKPRWHSMRRSRRRSAR